MKAPSAATVALLLIMLLIHLPFNLAHGQERPGPVQIYGGIGLTVPLAPDDFSRMHDIGLGAAAGLAIALPIRASLLIEGDYSAFPGGALAVFANLGSIQQAGITPVLQYEFAVDEGPQPYAVAGAGLTYTSFDDEPASPDDEAAEQVRDNEWNVRLMAGGGTRVPIQENLLIRTDLRLHYSIISHGDILYLTPRVSMSYSF